MLPIYLEHTNKGKVKIAEVISPVSGKELLEKLQSIIGISSNNFFFKNNGRLVESVDIVYTGDLLLEPKLCGGKGGFGSMLRAIGAQIEKTTNREACRDLSGRRLRDINKEKRLKAWIEKQSERNEEAAEKKKKKLERLCAEPKHEFKDKDYDKQRSTLTEKVEDAVEVGFATATSSAIKRAAETTAKTNATKKKKTILDLDDDIDSDDLESSDDEIENNQSTKITHNKSESENSSDYSSISPESSNKKKSNTENVSPQSKNEHDDTSR